MANIVVVNGEQYWQDYLPGHEVYFRRLQTSRWLLEKGRLFVRDASGALRVDAVLWRLGAVKPSNQHRAVLELIRLAGIPCVNPARTLLRGYDRLSMMAELKEAGLTVVPPVIGVGEHVLEGVEPGFPAVVKVGNFHGGAGKALVRDSEAWSDVKDMAFITDDYITVEDYVPYVRDIRCLAVGGRMWAMSRRGARWKANMDTVHFDLIDVPEPLARQTATAMSHLKADILGLDFLEAPDGSFVLLESNDIPGLSGFPDETRQALAAIVRRKVETVAD